MRVFLFLLTTSLWAETRPLTLREAAALASQQNPDLVLARLDEQAAQQAVQTAKVPFMPRVAAGSGLAYTNGFPMSIDGSAPSIVQARASSYLFNRQQSYIVAAAKENARAAGLGAAARRDEVLFRVATLYLEAERAVRIQLSARQQVESLVKVADAAGAAVREGRELPLASKRAAYDVARARQVVESLEADQANAETQLAVALGFSADDRVRPVPYDRAAPALPASEDEAVRDALAASHELRRLESQLAAKGLEIRGERAARLPRVDLVAQYALFARFNQYEDYYRSFQRHNGQIGASFQIPLFTGGAVQAAVAAAETVAARLRAELANTRNRLTADVRQSLREVHKAETAGEVARLDLELAREQLSVLLAQMQEGRATLRAVEEARIAESDKWIAFYDARFHLEKVRWAVLRYTGTLLASLQAEARP